jgi:outer membrane protein OmpA-like peptidoglycan-associated protein
MSRAVTLAIFGVMSTRAAAQGLDAQSFHPAVDGHHFLRLNDSLVGLKGPGGGFVFNYASDPLVFRYKDPLAAPEGLDETVLLSSVATVNLLGFYNVDRYRFGIDVPLNPMADGYRLDELEESFLLGDISLDAKMEIFDRHKEPIGLAVAVRASAPTGNDVAFLGAAQPTISAQAIAATGSEVITTVNLGIRTGRSEIEEDFTVGSQLIGGAGVRLPLASQTWITAETVGQYYFNASEPVAGFAAEALASLHVNPVEALVFTMGGGMGLSQGVGAPDFRVVSGLVWSPQRQPLRVMAADGPDLDADGITDSKDRCPDQPEDYNGIDDFDGCPDGEWTPTTLFVIGPNGSLVAGSSIELIRGPVTGEWVTEAGEMTRALLPGSYTLHVSAEGFEESEVALSVPGGDGFEQRLRIDALGDRDGHVVVHVTDIEGKSINAAVRVLGEDAAASRASSDGVVERSLQPGAHELVVSAEGYKTIRRMVTLREGSESLVDIILKPSRIEVREDRINLYDRIFFEYDSAIIKPESFTILDELADTLREYSHIVLVEIQGHTDERGAELYNLDLSQKRADSVRTYLVEAGVSQARLVSRGFGESTPLRRNAHEANRRVEFHILRSR